MQCIKCMLSNYKGWQTDVQDTKGGIIGQAISPRNGCTLSLVSDDSHSR